MSSWVMPLLSLMERIFFAMRLTIRQVFSSMSCLFFMTPSWGHDLSRTTTCNGRINGIAVLAASYRLWLTKHGLFDPRSKESLKALEGLERVAPAQ